ncbi:related to DOA1 - involved in ubiquitin-dependent proteolysis [Pseudozyma flocculosa]|uniref:Related to DOA1 - involved in ubiquitin-dependent proteolysis n=1 Tax=Pseudozyma flocculosa TaxID=84751 RepID=A0A5C3FAF0_9BASI|nr:related to DOA1 - involved in ubiquitin-dependent proteolysis [Pseudozyma flocculosa]
MAAAPYKLSSQLAGHSADVRSVSTCATATGHHLILSASRDATARIWLRRAGQRDFTPAAELSGHDGFVNASAFLQDPSGSIVALTAGQDRIVHGFEVQATGDGVKASAAPDYAMIGHEDNVCTLDVGPRGSYIVSGSWDKTAKVWREFQCVATLKGHQQAVWAVVAVDEDRILTASADKTIRLWSIATPDRPLATFTGHSDAVRGLVLLDGGASFASCGNDGTINLYSLASLQPGSSSGGGSGGSSIPPLQTLSGHTSFVYSLATVPGGRGELISSGEDRSARIWRDGEAAQTITIPAISVWSVAALPDGDVVCGSSDSFVRVFSRDARRQAEAAELQAYEHTIASQALNKTQVGDVRKDDLPGPEALAQPGAKEGQTKMVRNGDVVEAHQWSTASGSWVKIGEVVGGVGSGQKKLHEGKEYDYVFDVDIADGVPPLKLPYNLSENPYAAAQRFLEANELSSEYVEQVVQFIDKNTEGVNIGATSSYVDPYTGASRYTGGGGGGGGAGAAAPPAFSAPTTGGQYTGGNNVDPFTSSAQPSRAATQGVLPQRAFLTFATTNLAAVKEKLRQFNGEESTQLSQDELDAVDRVAAAVQQKQTSGRLDVGPLQKALAAWKPASRLPVFDLFRCAVAHPVTADAVDVARTAFEASEWSQDWPAAGSPEVKAREVNSMLALRAIANLWNNPEALGDLSANGISILGSLKDTHFARLNKNGRVAYASVVYNATAQMVGSTSRSPAAALTVEMINEVLQHEAGESEVVYRALVALGNLLYSTSSGSLPVGALQSAKNLMRKWAGSSSVGSEERIKAICAEIQSL